VSEQLLQAMLSCFGVAGRNCGRVIAAVSRFDTALTLFSRFGTTGSLVAATLILAGRALRRGASTAAPGA
jgi:hypothetical protein